MGPGLNQLLRSVARMSKVKLPLIRPHLSVVTSNDGIMVHYTQVWRDQPRENPKKVQPPRGFPEVDLDTRGE